MSGPVRLDVRLREVAKGQPENIRPPMACSPFVVVGMEVQRCTEASLVVVDRLHQAMKSRSACGSVLATDSSLLAFVPSAQYRTVPASQKGIADQCRHLDARRRAHALHLLSALPLGVARDALPSRGARPDRLYLLFGEPDLTAASGQRALRDGEVLHDLGVGPTEAAKLPPELCPLPSAQQLPSLDGGEDVLGRFTLHEGSICAGCD